MVSFKDQEEAFDKMIEQVATARGLLYDILQGLNKQKKEVKKEVKTTL